MQTCEEINKLKSQKQKKRRKEREWKNTKNRMKASKKRIRIVNKQAYYEINKKKKSFERHTKSCTNFC